jgi:hypothetical protein
LPSPGSRQESRKISISWKKSKRVPALSERVVGEIGAIPAVMEIDTVES